MAGTIDGWKHRVKHRYSRAPPSAGWGILLGVKDWRNGSPAGDESSETYPTGTKPGARAVSQDLPVQRRAHPGNTTLGAEAAPPGDQRPGEPWFRDEPPLAWLGAVQRQGDDTEGAVGAGAVHAAAAVGTSGPPGRLPHLDAIQPLFGRHDVTSVRAYTDAAAARGAKAMGAEGFAVGDQVAFDGAPGLHTAAHEAAHVVQQRAGVALAGGVGANGDPYERHADAVADRVVRGESAESLLDGMAGAGARAPAAPGTGAAVQLRRLPSTAGTLLQDPGDASQPGANFAAHCEGMKRLLTRAIRELTPDNLAALDGTLGADWQTRLAASSDPQFITRVSNEIRTVRPDLTLGDPALINVAPTTGSVDEANLATLVSAANTIFDAITGGGHDTDLEQVFGAAHVATARDKYAQGKHWLNELHTRGAIVTDRSGYAGEVGLGGLTGFQRRISLSPGIFDNPSAAASVITTIHESMHAGNADVRDHGYIHQPAFRQLAEDVKLRNAAHYEVVPRRILGAAHAFPGETFVPAGASVGGVTAPALTDAEQVIRRTSEKFRLAWTYGLNLHSLFLSAYREPTGWTTDRSGKTWAGALPYWSKVMKLTVHEKTSIDPASADPARRPVSQIDMALAEGLTRRLSQAMRGVPRDEAALTALEDAQLTSDERTAARASIDTRQAALVRLVLRLPTVGELTGPLDRDVRVVETLSTLVWSTVLEHRDVSSFPD